MADSSSRVHPAPREAETRSADATYAAQGRPECEPSCPSGGGSRRRPTDLSADAGAASRPGGSERVLSGPAGADGPDRGLPPALSDSFGPDDLPAWRDSSVLLGYWDSLKESRLGQLFRKPERRSLLEEAAESERYPMEPLRDGIDDGRRETFLTCLKWAGLLVGVPYLIWEIHYAFVQPHQETLLRLLLTGLDGFMGLFLSRTP
jgi:hypothetical protein